MTCSSRILMQRLNSKVTCFLVPFTTSLSWCHPRLQLARKPLGYVQGYLLRLQRDIATFLSAEYFLIFQNGLINIRAESNLND